MLKFNFRFVVAVKCSNNNVGDVAFLDEAKSMVQIGEYHKYIVNLQGVVFDETNDKGAKV